MIEINKVIDFVQQRENMMKMVENNEDVKNAYLSTTWEEGKELWLKIKITDRYLSQILVGLLHSNEKAVKGYDNLGFQVQEIIFNPRGYTDQYKGILKKKLLDEFNETLNKLL